METDPDNLSPVDREALERALTTAANDLAQREQIEAMLREDGWYETATYAAFSCQVDALKLRPWQTAPCHADELDPDPVDPKAQELLREMLRLGLSRFEPDPAAALLGRRGKGSPG